jgi:pimeloyl-ACP methyl ester carboxylesterase
LSNTPPTDAVEVVHPFTTDSLTLAVQRAISVSSAVCGQSEDPEYLAHLNAPNVARDLDLIRSLTGFETIDYFGLDYGTVIGVTYAALFPSRVGHMLLDGTRISDKY